MPYPSVRKYVITIYGKQHTLLTAKLLMVSSKNSTEFGEVVLLQKQRLTGKLIVLHTNIKKGTTQPTFFTISGRHTQCSVGEGSCFHYKNKNKCTLKNYKRGISNFVSSSRTSLSQKCDIIIISLCTVDKKHKHPVKAVLS